MTLAERICLIRLTAVGIRALESVVDVTEKGSFEAWVKDQDEQGLWVSPIGEEAAGRRAGLLLLVKWDYLATIQVLGEGQ